MTEPTFTIEQIEDIRSAVAYLNVNVRAWKPCDLIAILTKPPKDYDELMAEFVKLRKALEFYGDEDYEIASQALASLPEEYRGLV